MMDKIEYKGYFIHIDQSDDTENPLNWTTPEERGAWFVMSHRRYDVPCELDIVFDEFNSYTDLAKNLPEMKNKPYMFVKWYEHSGITVSLQDNETNISGFDTGCVGVIFGETTEDIKIAFNDWKAYIEGDIYDYSITDDHGELVDSLCCIFGYDNTLDQAKEFVDGYKPPRKVLKASALHNGGAS